MSPRSSTLSFSVALTALAAWGALAFAAAAGLLQMLDTGHAHSARRFAPSAAPVIVGLGDSRTRAFHYPSLGSNGYSLQEDGSDLTTAEYRLRMALGAQPGIELVLLTYLPGTLDFDFERAGGSPSARQSWTLNAPFAPRAMTAGEMRDRLFAEVRVYGNGSNLALARIAALTGRSPQPDGADDPCLRRPPRDHRADEHGIPGGYPQPAPAGCLARVRTAVAHSAQIRASLRADPGLHRENLARLERMIALARAHGAQLVLVTPPVTEFYARAPELRAVWDRQTAEARALSRRNGVAYLDFRDFYAPAEYVRDNRVFSDDSHLTLAGAERFSRALRRALDDKGLLPVTR